VSLGEAPFELVRRTGVQEFRSFRGTGVARVQEGGR